ncbi:MAG: ammonia-dependent NAD(+) synthetase [Enterobacteriaceae bacterium]
MLISNIYKLIMSLYMIKKKQKEIINKFKVKSFIYPKIELRRIINFLKKYLIENKKVYSFVVGISGGQDSTLVGKICQKSIEEFRGYKNKKKYKFIALNLPYGNQIDEEDCNESIKFIKPDEVLNINIKKIVDKNVREIRNKGIKITDNLKSNLKSRERMKIQYSIAYSNSGIVVGTNNASEALTGFFTKHGDNGVDINPIIHLNKRQISLILKSINCPKNLYNKIPMSGLSDIYPSLADEYELRVSYKDIDDYLEGKSINPYSELLIEYMYEITKHKRSFPMNLTKFYK